MVENAPALFNINRKSPVALSGEDGAMILQEYEEKMYESDRRENGYQDSYKGNASMYSAQAQSQDRAQEKHERPQQRSPQQVYLTPAPKREREASKQRDGSRGREHKSKDGKKRKRHHAEDLDLTAARTSYDRDSVMTEAPTLHSGLTGGIEKMFSRRSGVEYPSPSPDYPDDIPVAETPASPLKRTRHSRTETRPEPRGRDKRVRGSLLLSLVSSGTSTVSTRKSSSSTQHTTSDDRPPKKHHRHRRREDSERPHQRKVKAIEYHPIVERDDSQNQLVVYRTRAELFTSFVRKGPESTLGCSMNKALKRYHRERADQGIGLGRAEEEKELWKSLRMKKNDRGEIVLFF
jgi:cell growth-regulating nucleolar protein